MRHAKTMAYWLSRGARDWHLAAWSLEAMQLRQTARELTVATSLEDAWRKFARVAGACGACHVKANARAAFERDTIAPLDEGTSDASLARHRWAARRVWDGRIEVTTALRPTESCS